MIHGMFTEDELRLWELRPHTNPRLRLYSLPRERHVALVTAGRDFPLEAELLLAAIDRGFGEQTQARSCSPVMMSFPPELPARNPPVEHFVHEELLKRPIALFGSLMASVVAALCRVQKELDKLEINLAWFYEVCDMVEMLEKKYAIHIDFDEVALRRRWRSSNRGVAELIAAYRRRQTSDQP